MKLFNDMESEKILINQMIIDDSIIDDVIVKAPIESFYNQAYKNCYQAILNINGRSEKVDLTSFYTECRTKDLASFETLEAVTNATSSAINWKFYAENVMNCFQSRQLQRLLAETGEKITRDNSKELIALLSKSSDDITSLNDDVVVKTQREVMIDLVPKIQQMISNPESLAGWKTGLNAFDSITGGINKEFIMICARPSMGKTFLAQQISLHIAKEHKVDFIELEMSAEQVNFRNIAMLSNLRMNEIRYGLIKSDLQKVKRVQQAMEILAGQLADNYRIVEPVSRKLSTITSHIRRAVKREGVEMVVIDHVGLIQSDNRYGSSWESAREISNGLQKLQRELKIPIIALSQRSRSSEGGKEKGDLSTIRGSGAYEEDADLILTIEHARATDNSQKDKIGADAENIECELYVSKNRNGGCGIGKCMFRPSYGKFIDVLKN